MSEEIVNRSDDDVLQERVREYKAMLEKEKPDLDISLLLRILDIVNGDSEVRVAINPIASDGEWSSAAPSYAVSGVTTLEDGRITLKVSGDTHGITADKLYTKLRRQLHGQSGVGEPVLFVHKDTITQLTDAYSHALRRQQMAGLPFDLVLAVKTDQEDSGEAE